MFIIIFLFIMMGVWLDLECMVLMAILVQMSFVFRQCGLIVEVYRGWLIWFCRCFSLQMLLLKMWIFVFSFRVVCVVYLAMILVFRMIILVLGILEILLSKIFLLLFVVVISFVVVNIVLILAILFMICMIGKVLDLFLIYFIVSVMICFCWSLLMQFVLIMGS